MTIELLPGLVAPSRGLSEVAAMVEAFACVNPHARFEIDGRAIESREPGMRKWLPGSAMPVHWYSSERFAHRVLAELRRDPKVTVAQFISTFAGLADRSKRARIAEAARLQHQPLAALLDASGIALDERWARRLWAAMLDEAKPPSPRLLALLGKVGWPRPRPAP